MEYMATLPDKAFDLAIIDPPYGIDANTFGAGSRCRKYNRKSIGWDNAIPDKEYFDELFRASKNQIIFGGNYFKYIWNYSNSFLVWDKKQPEKMSFAMSELIWLSFKTVSKTFYKHPSGQKYRIHPTQKPVALYEWLLMNYAKEGDRILDTHLGSGSSRIAAHKLGFEFVGCELDKDYFEAQEERFRLETMQQNLFV